MSQLCQNLHTARRPLILYELIPPARGTPERAVEAYAECAVELMASTSLRVDGVNLPEIRAERRSAARTHPYEPKTDPRRFAQRLAALHPGPLEVVVNRCTVYEEWTAQQQWLHRTRAEFGVRNLVLVGGESSRVRYPGPSVIEMAQSVRYVYGEAFCCGGVTIPTRRHPDPRKDEPQRLIEKARHGLEFFTSQVLYEPHSTRRLLRDYARRCREQGQPLKRIFLSFAPVSSRKDLAFLRWLGVEVPPEVEATLLKADLGVGWRSLQTAKAILKQILEFVRAEALPVPLGLNIEHITRHNFELSKEFIEALGSMLYAFYEKERP